MFGVLPVLPIEIRFPRPPTAVEQVAVRDRTMTEIRQVTSRRVRVAKKKYYDSKRSTTQELGDLEYNRISGRCGSFRLTRHN